ncbi:MAG: anthranilate synthase component I family protein [Phycisphaerales bacterium]|nr:anthranilate synthase component I family protein [Phycisphaerales bacterium]
MQVRAHPELEGTSPLEAMTMWPTDAPLAALHSNPQATGSARWSMLATPRGRAECSPSGGRWIGHAHPLMEAAAARGVLAALEAVDSETEAAPQSEDLPPFAGWIACLHYELGYTLEPATNPDACPESVVADLLWCPDAYMHDAATGRWWVCGSPPPLRGGKPNRMASIGPISSAPPATMWPDVVARAIEYIRAGDIFQVNLCRQLHVPVTGDPRGFAVSALAEPQTAFGACLECGDRTIVSLSPELFLEIDATGAVVTRPIKGTAAADVAPGVLLDSEKDAAELHMIVDLMRNDLGRVCDTGSVEVVCPRRIETHPTVHHGVAEVHGQLKPAARLLDVLRAAFPAGSITGAPKIRAMQIARTLEPEPRGVYCGAIGMIGPGSQLRLSVAIRTAVIENGMLHYGVGCGIVADSDPETELAESEMKAEVLRRTLVTQPCEAPFAGAAGPRSPA